MDEGLCGLEEELVRSMIEVMGDDPHRPGLKDTPRRVLDMWKEVFSGYHMTIEDVDSMFTTFTESDCDEMIVLRDIEFTSHCEHHLMPFLGRGHIGYIPRDGLIVGLSKLARLLDGYSRRLQIQERIGIQVVHSIKSHLNPIGCGCVLEADHLCVKCRGVGKQNSRMVTSSMRGSFREDNVRSEFLRMIGK